MSFKVLLIAIIPTIPIFIIAIITMSRSWTAVVAVIVALLGALIGSSEYIFIDMAAALAALMLCWKALPAPRQLSIEEIRLKKEKRDKLIGNISFIFLFLLILNRNFNKEELTPPLVNDSAVLSKKLIGQTVRKVDTPQQNNSPPASPDVKQYPDNIISSSTRTVESKPIEYGEIVQPKCVYKNIMSDADYIACGIRPPQTAQYLKVSPEEIEYYQKAAIQEQVNYYNAIARGDMDAARVHRINNEYYIKKMNNQ